MEIIKKATLTHTRGTTLRTHLSIISYYYQIYSFLSLCIYKTEEWFLIWYCVTAELSNPGSSLQNMLILLKDNYLLFNLDELHQVYESNAVGHFF